MTTPAIPPPAWTPDGLTALSARPAANAGARTLTRADNDLDAVSGWLLRHQDSPHTFDSYKREAERLLAWCASRSQTLSALMAEDLVAYQRFLQDPQPRETWCLQSEPRYLAPGVPNPDWQSVRRPPRYLADGSPNPAWRPFVSGLSPSAAKQATTILFGLFEYLCAIGYLAGNPLRAARTRATRPRQQTVQRYLGQESWQFVLEHLESWPRATAREVAHYQHTKFLISFFVSDGAAAQRGSAGEHGRSGAAPRPVVAARQWQRTHRLARARCARCFGCTAGLPYLFRTKSLAKSAPTGTPADGFVWKRPTTHEQGSCTRL